MTPSDHPSPPDLPFDDGPLDDDALAVHAVVDDEATAEQRRRVARDPELVAQVAALRETVAAVAAPVDPPGADVLATLRRRALDALDEPATTPEPELEDPGATDVSPAPRPAPVGDLGAARARRSRTLPPLPAVAAVVVLLVLVGVGLIVAGGGGTGESSADSAGSGAGSETTTGDDGGDAEAADSPAAQSAEEDLASQFDRPADEIRDELLGQATATYASDDDLVDDLEEVDPLGLGLSARGATTDGDEAATTTVPSTSTTGSDASSTTAPDLSYAARAYAADPVAARCDDVLRAAEPDLEPAVAAVLVEVDGEPVVILSNPGEVSDRSPSGLRLTALNAVDCSPRAAVLR